MSRKPEQWRLARFKVSRTDGTSHEILVKGRWRWALECLLRAGPKGCTPIDTPGPRWSGYVHLLRHEYQVEIETIREKHGGPFEGTHARYVLKSGVTPVEEVAA